MRPLLAFLVAFCCFGSLESYAQDKNVLPPRFDAFAKNDRFRLMRVLGSPELPAVFGQLSAFSADGKRGVYAEDLSSGSDDKLHLRTRFLVWDLPAKSFPREIDIDGKHVTAFCLSADGSKALLACQTFVGLKKGDAKDKEKEKPGVPEFLSHLALLDLNAGKEIKSISMKSSASVGCVALAPNEATALAGSALGVGRWDLKDGKLLASYREDDPAMQVMIALAFLPDGKRFLAGHWTKGPERGGIVRLWDISKKQPVRSFPEKGDLGGFVWSLGVSRDGKRFVCGDSRPALSLWEIDTGKEIGTLHDEKRAGDQIVTAAVFADDDKTVLGLFSKLNPDADDFQSARLVAWSGEVKAHWAHSVPYKGTPPTLVKDGKLLIGGGPNLFETWNLKDGKKIETWGAHKGPINVLAALAGGDFFSAGQEGQVMTWRHGEVESKRQAHAGAISVIVVSGDKKQWLTGGTDRTVKLWSRNPYTPVRFMKGHTGPVTALAFGKDGKWACSGSTDRAVKTWNLATGKQIATFENPDGVNAVALSPDELWLASACDDANIRVFPIKDGKLDPDRDTLVLEGHKKPVSCLAFSPDGKTLLSGSQDQTLKVWDWAKEKATRTIPGHKNWVTSLLFIDTNAVLTTSDDLTICVWELATGKETARIDFGSVGDCPRCVTRLGSDRLLVGTSNWLIYEFQMLPAGKSKGETGSSK